MMSRCGINCHHFLVRWSLGQQEPMSPEGIFSFTEPSSSRKHQSTTTKKTVTFKIKHNQRNAVQIESAGRVYSCILFLSNSFRALRAAGPLFWGLIWHRSDVWPCCDRHCRSEWERNWPSCMLLCPKPPATASAAIMEAQRRHSCVKMMPQSTWICRLQGGGYRKDKSISMQFIWSQM